MKHQANLFSAACIFLVLTNCLGNGATEAHDATEPLKLNLLICLYNETNERRANEYIYCLEKNLAHPMIKQIHVSYDLSRDPQKNGTIHQWLQEHNITISYIKGRQTIGHCFRLANKLFPDEYAILSNADIWFDETLLQLEARHLESNLLACTRYKKRERYSQDTWIFKIPFPEHRILNQILVGQISCEGPIVFAAKKAKLHVYNPCRSINCIHQHRIRTQGHPKARYWGIVELPHCTLDEIAERKGAAMKKPIYRLRIPQNFCR